ncbi:MAG TPA: hypothetical protein VKA95_10140 [Nitrososphaeraceae archaeon]|nr:hypothetical protein [Nitrososphaeraceae archaeon]
MPKNQYNICNSEERKEFFYECIINKLPNIGFDEFQEDIGFLCSKGLSNEWLNVHGMSIGGTLFPSVLRTETKMLYPITINQLLELARCLRVFDNDRISYYIKKLNTEQDFNKISVISEIIVTSKYFDVIITQDRKESLTWR